MRPGAKLHRQPVLKTTEGVFAGRRSKTDTVGTAPVRQAALVALWLMLAPVSGAGQPGDWQAHTPFREVTSIASGARQVWASTLGGVFSYDTSNGEIRRYTTVEGLHGIDARALASDEADGVVWIGYGDGVIDRLSVETGDVRRLLDIARAVQFASRGINKLVTRGDSLFALTDFGVVIFDTNALEVRDAYTRIGTWGAATPARDIHFSGSGSTTRIWVASEQGVAHGPLTGANLREPSLWTVEATLGRTTAYAVTTYRGRIHAATERDVMVQDEEGMWTALGVAGSPVFDLLVAGDALYGAEEFSLVRRNADGSSGRWFVFREGPLGDAIPYQFPRFLAADGSGRIWLGDEREGLIGLPPPPPGGENRIENGQPILPAGPEFGLFTDITFDAGGALWVSGAPANGSGFHRLRDGAWSDFTARTRPELSGRAGFDHIHADGAGGVWAGSAGFGIAHVDADETLTVYDASNSALRPAAGTAGYVRVLGLITEADGTLWAINQFSAFPLVARLADGSWNALAPIRATGAPASMTYRRLYIDSSGQKWVLADKSQGLIVWSTAGTPEVSEDDQSRYIRGLGSGGLGLPNESVTSWVQDGSGKVWIGTERGLAYYIAPSLVLTNDPGAYQAQWPITEDASGERSFLLRDLFINDLAADAANRLWIASRSGAWQLNADGTAVIRHFTMADSPLFSDNVVAVAVDDRTGRVYFATDKGLVSFQGDAVAAEETVVPLRIHPNPARGSGDADLHVVIDGLVSETDVRILSVSGVVARRLDGRGGRVTWDGRADDGSPVPSGVYIVAAVGRNGEETAYGKVAVVR